MASINDIMKRFVINGALTFSGGDVELMHTRFVMISNDIWGRFFYDLREKPEYTAQFYRLLKDDATFFLHDAITKKFDFNFNSAQKWFVDMLKIQGWGYPEWLPNKEDTNGTVTIKGSPVALYLKGKKMPGPSDHILRGFVAGGTSVAYKTAIHCIETECEATGGRQCTFVYDTLPKLQEKYPELVKLQVGNGAKDRILFMPEFV